MSVCCEKGGVWYSGCQKGDENMDWTQAITIIAAVLIPTLCGFAWMVTWLRSIDQRLNFLETRMAVVETRMGFVERLIEMMGYPIKPTAKERAEK